MPTCKYRYMQGYILQCLQVARKMQESQLQNVPTCYKQIRENMNKQEQTNDISSSNPSSNPHFKQMKTEKKTINISLTDHLVHFLIREFFLSRVIQLLTHTCHTSHSFEMFLVCSTPHGKSFHISRMYHGIPCGIWICLVLHGIV